MSDSKKLIGQLKEFGLNPRFWLLKKIKQKGMWLVIHKHNHELCLKGTVSPQNRWKELEWQMD